MFHGNIICCKLGLGLTYRGTSITYNVALNKPLLWQSMEKLRKSLEVLDKRDSNDLPELYPELVAKTVGLKKTQEAWAKYHKLYMRHLEACDEEAKDEEGK